MTIAGQNACRSAGERLVVSCPSTTTSSSIMLAPAFRSSVRMLGQEVSRRPPTRPASSSVQGHGRSRRLGFDLAVLDAEKLGLGAGAAQRSARLLQLHSLDPVRRQDGDFLPR